jgi:aerobic C4-dicarboxylate transport protein
MINLKKSLTFWVLTALVFGILVGSLSPKTGVAMQPLGKYFIKLVKLFINPIIVVTVLTGICGMESLKKVGRVGAKTFIYFEIVTSIALAIGLIVAYFINPGAGIDRSKFTIHDVGKYKGNGSSIDWLHFLQGNLTIQLLFLSIAVGIILSRWSNKNIVLDKVKWVSHYLFLALQYVLKLSPIGAFGGMAYTIGKYGIAALFPLGKLMLCVYITMFFFIVVVLGSILRYYEINIWKFIKYIREELLVVLGTASCEAALPAQMNKLEQMGCHKSVVGLVIPAGYTFNLDGTSIYLSMSVIFLAQVFNIELSVEQMLTFFGILMVTSKGAAGVTGSGFILLASTLSAINIIPVEGLALLLGVDRFMSEARAITNFIGNGVVTIAISNNEKMFNKEQMKLALAG